MDYSGDDFFIDDLLDLSNADDVADENKNKPCSLSPPHNKEEETLLTNNSPVKQDFIADPFLQGPDFDNLEWLSNFVEDSFSDYSLTYSPGNLPEKRKSCFTGSVQTKAGPPSMSLASSSSSVSARKPPKEKKKKKMEKRAGIGAKQCSHCGVQKTPLWRTGPLGEKTLCNACGVRFKSGRLLPEYRPASSPTFSTGLHSNSHRKVLEMRQKKETESGRPVQSF